MVSYFPSFTTISISICFSPLMPPNDECLKFYKRWFNSPEDNYCLKIALFSRLPTIVRVLNTNLFSLKRTVERLQFRSSIFVAKSVALGKNVTLDKMQCFK